MGKRILVLECADEDVEKALVDILTVAYTKDHSIAYLVRVIRPQVRVVARSDLLTSG